MSPVGLSSALAHLRSFLAHVCPAGAQSGTRGGNTPSQSEPFSCRTCEKRLQFRPETAGLTASPRAFGMALGSQRRRPHEPCGTADGGREHEVVMKLRGRAALVGTAVVASLVASAAPARALDRLCDPANENCRTILINYIRAETVGIDVGVWFMEDSRYSTELINRFKAGVRVRVLVDPRANTTTPLNAQRLSELQAAGIPMRKKASGGILHYKMMLFAGQNVVEFSGANYSADAWAPIGTTPYQNYIDESIYFTNDPAIVHSFMTRFDDVWTNTTTYANYANVTGTLTREYPTFTKDSHMNFPPAESYANRAVGRYNAETQKIDVIMFRITDQRHTNAMI